VTVTGSSNVFCGISVVGVIFVLSAIVTITYTMWKPYTTNLANEFSQQQISVRILRQLPKNRKLKFKCTQASCARFTGCSMHIDKEINKKRAALKKGTHAEKPWQHYALAKSLYKKYVTQVFSLMMPSFIQTPTI
jgi:hypothetical protein